MSITEINGDLFSILKEENTSYGKLALAHCVSKDLYMGKGIAVNFKNTFGKVEELKAQQKDIGDLAYLEHGDITVFYLITKSNYFGKPTYKSLESCLLKLRDLALEREINTIAIPQIGCGLDQLNWFNVKADITNILVTSGINIIVYYL